MNSTELVICAGLDGTAAPASEEARAGLGVLLLPRNINDPHQLYELCTTLRARSTNVYLTLDQEGGPVNRIRPFLGELPSWMALGSVADSELAFRWGICTASLLAIFGISVDFAPVVDLALSDRDNGIGLRAASSDPRLVSRLGAAFLNGLHEQGVRGVLKHYPGLGDTDADTHLARPRIREPWDRRRRTLSAFSSVFDELSRDRERLSGDLPVPGVMMSHAAWTGLDQPGDVRPPLACTLDPRAYASLGSVLPHTSLVVTDDLCMAGAGMPVPEAAEMAIRAGAHMLILEDSAEATSVALHFKELAVSDSHFEAALDGACRRVRDFLPSSSTLEPDFPQARYEQAVSALQTLGREISRRAVCWNGSTLATPPRPPLGDLSYLIPETEFCRHLVEMIKLAAGPIWYPRDLPRDAVSDFSQRLQDEKPVVLVTLDAHRHDGQRLLARTLLNRKLDLYHIAAAYPDDLSGELQSDLEESAQARALSISLFGSTEIGFTTALDIIHGRFEPVGRKPL